jgi:diguanylate cyclase (GGDEF)-like protein
MKPLSEARSERMRMPEIAVKSALPQETEAVGIPAHGRSRQDVDFWMNCVGAPLVLVEMQDLTVRQANRNAAILFGRGLEAFDHCQMEELVGPEATMMLGQIWNVAPVGTPGEPFIIPAQVQGQERSLMVQVTKIAVEDETLRLFTFMDAPPQGSVALAGWQDNMLSMLNWLPFGFEIASSDDQIQFANSTFKELFGFSQDDISDIEDWWRVAYPDPEYRAYARKQWYDSIAAARAEQREMTPFDLDVATATGRTRTIQFRHRTIGNFNINLYIDVTQERAAARELKRLAETDALTGAMNRRRLMDEAARLQAESENRSAACAFLMLDIDHFKSINDRYGHSVGDRVLVDFTRRCLDALEPRDRFGRMGGEEFAVLLRRPDGAAIADAAEKLRSAVGSTPFRIDHHDLAITVSIGAVLCDPETSLEAGISRADNALYMAKEAGRDRVIMWKAP